MAKSTGKTIHKRVPTAAKCHKQKKLAQQNANQEKTRYDRKEGIAVGKKSLLNHKQTSDLPDLAGLQSKLAGSRANQKIQNRQALERNRDLNNAIKFSQSTQLQEKFASHQVEQYEQQVSVESRRKWYFRELLQVVDACDVIIEVLDARDPLGCRALDIERRIVASTGKDGHRNKRVILLLNKCDMVPPENVAAWLQYLKREHPCLAFKSSTQKGRGHLQRLDLNLNKNTDSSAVHSQSSVGAATLLQLLKNYSRTTSSMKGGLTVGVIGYPNVGKSSVINSLKAQRVTQVSPAAGCTKVLQYVKLDNNITLVDSPGVLFGADFDNNDTSEEAVKAKQGLLLRNALRADQVEDPQEVVKAILTRITKEQLMEIYEISDFKNIEELLLFIAHRNGKLVRGGVPNLDEAAKIIINDWNFGKISFYTNPPALNDIQESTIVTTYSEAFDIDALLDSGNDTTVKVIKDDKIYETRGINAGKINGMGDSDAEDDYVVDNDNDVMDDDDDDDDDDDGLYGKASGSFGMNSVNITAKITSMQEMLSNEVSEVEEEVMDAATAYKLQQQQAYYLEKQTIDEFAQSHAHGKAKAATVLSKKYQLEGVQRAMTKGELKKKAKAQKKAALRAQELNYDFESEDDSNNDINS